LWGLGDVPHGITLAVALVQKTSVKAQVTAPRLCRLIVEIMRVVICGAGVIGACTAYFLSRRGIDVVVLERTDVPRHPARQAGFWRSTGAPARRSDARFRCFIIAAVKLDSAN